MGDYRLIVDLWLMDWIPDKTAEISETGWSCVIASENRRHVVVQFLNSPLQLLASIVGHLFQTNESLGSKKFSISSCDSTKRVFRRPSHRCWEIGSLGMTKMNPCTKCLGLKLSTSSSCVVSISSVTTKIAFLFIFRYLRIHVIPCNTSITTSKKIYPLCAQLGRNYGSPRGFCFDVLIMTVACIDMTTTHYSQYWEIRTITSDLWAIVAKDKVVWNLTGWAFEAGEPLTSFILKAIQRESIPALLLEMDWLSHISRDPEAEQVWPGVMANNI